MNTEKSLHSCTKNPFCFFTWMLKYWLINSEQWIHSLYSMLGSIIEYIVVCRQFVVYFYCSYMTWFLNSQLLVFCICFASDIEELMTKACILQFISLPINTLLWLLFQGLDLLKPFLKSILIPSATVHSYNMVLLITSKPSCSTIVGLITS